MTKTKTKNKTGWVIRNRKTGRFLNRFAKSEYTMKLENALIYPTRSWAREETAKMDTVNKVLLNSKLRATKVIAGNGTGCII